MHECIDCGHLDKSRKEKSPNGTGHYNYGCNAPGRIHTCGWIKKDSELNLQGGSCWIDKGQVIKTITPVQMDIFDLVI